MRGLLASLLVVALPFLAHAAAGSSDVWFNDWLQGKGQGATARPASGYGAEWKSVCLRDTGYRACGCTNLPSYYVYPTGYFYCYDDFNLGTTVSCCGGDDQRDQLGTGFLDAEVGSCEWRVDRNFAVLEPIDGPFIYGTPTSTPNVYKYGTFSVQCKLNANSESCGHPLCESMVLTGYGALYAVDGGYVDSLPTLPGSNSECTDTTVYTIENGPRHSRRANTTGKSTTRAPAKLKNGYINLSDMFSKSQRSVRQAAKRGKEVPIKTAAYGHDHERPYYGGDRGDGPRMGYETDYAVWAGTFYVTNAGKSTKYAEGFLEYVWDYDGDINPTPVPVPSGAYLATPFQTKLKFVESGDQY